MGGKLTFASLIYGFPNAFIPIVSEELEAVTRKLERWYDVSFFFTGESLKIKRFSGSIPKYSDLSKVLKMLELTTNIRFKKTDKTVVVEMIQ